MKILLLAPPWMALPVKGYGGIERVVYDLAEGLTKNGHEVITFATGDSQVPGKLAYFYEKSLGYDLLTYKSYALYMLDHISGCLQSLPKDIDIIHNHCEYLGMHLLQNINTPIIHTLHGPFYEGFDKERHSNDLLTPAIRTTLQLFKNNPFISISDYQRTGMPNLNYIATIYNGLDLNSLHFNEQPQDYIYWIGRYSPQKGLDKTIQIAQQLHKKLIFSVSIHKDRVEEFNAGLGKEVDNTMIINKGECTDPKEKDKLIGNAKLLLYPLQGEEPFGIVLAEGLATGTPVVAFARGAAPEIINDGVNGFLVNPSDDDIRGNFTIKKTGMEGLAEAVEKIYTMDETTYITMRHNARKHVEEKFSRERMTQLHEEAYKKVIKKDHSL